VDDSCNLEMCSCGVLLGMCSCGLALLFNLCNGFFFFFYGLVS
jgi:hypothetical protein